MKRHGNLYAKIYDMDNLRYALQKAKRGKMYQSGVQKVMQNPEKYLLELQRLLITRQYHTSEYQRKVIYEPKRREIFVLPFFPDRICHQAIMNILEPIWEAMFIKDSYACRKNKGQHKGSKRCKEFVRRNPYVLQCDVSKFYPSINHDKLKAIVRRKIKDPDLLYLLDGLIDSSPGVPIGNYTSQWLGNLYLNDLDTKVKQIWRVKDYFRYCDDFYIFGTKERLRELRPKILEYMHGEMKVRLSKCELYPTSHGVDALGYRHFPNGKILLRKSTAKRVKARFKAMPHNLAHGKLTTAKALGQLASAHGWLKHANTYHFRHSLNFPMIKELIRKYDEVQ